MTRPKLPPRQEIHLRIEHNKVAKIRRVAERQGRSLQAQIQRWIELQLLHYKDDGTLSKS